MSIVDPPESSDPIGEELREFFIDLLRGQNLQEYQSSGRSTTSRGDAMKA